jgi:hypothetical protein
MGNLKVPGKLPVRKFLFPRSKFLTLKIKKVPGAQPIILPNPENYRLNTIFKALNSQKPFATHPFIIKVIFLLYSPFTIN